MKLNARRTRMALVVQGAVLFCTAVVPAAHGAIYRCQIDGRPVL
jgi:hypothetical protein